MHTNAARRLISAIMALLCLLTASAYAENVYTTESAYVYAYPNAAAQQLAALPAGVEMGLVAAKDGWALINLSGKQGFVQISSLAKVERQPAQASMTAYAREGAKVFASYSTSSAVVTSLEANTAVTVTDIKSGWCRIDKGGETYFMLQSELSPAPIQQTQQVQQPQQAAAQPITAYVQSAGARVYAGCSTSARALGVLDVNTAVSVFATINGWCAVVKDGNRGFMLKSDLGTSMVTVPQQQAQSQAAALAYGNSGDAVKALQTRLQALGYFYGNIGGNYKDQTKSAVGAFQSAHGIPVTGTADAVTLAAIFSDSAKKAAASTAVAASGSAKEMDWWKSDIRSIFAVGVVATITDVKTGISWREIRKGGTNHADVQPVTAADTAAMKKACGSWSWDRRAIIVTIGGVNYAASMNCMPHGSGSITDNNFDGHHCIHFTNSRTHGGNAVCPKHQAAIKVAAAWRA